MPKISEIFYSIQGEGKLAGMPSIFIRTSDCNLRCVWCDTKYASRSLEGKELNISQILAKVQKYSFCKYVVISGGEPSIAQNIIELTQELRKLQKHITIETNGTIFIPELALDLASISPKLRHSSPIGTKFESMHEQNRLNWGSLKKWITRCDYQLKFVVSKPKDMQEINEIVEKLGVASEKVMLMPLGVSSEELGEREKWMARECMKYGYRFTPRLHIHLFGNV